MENALDVIILAAGKGTRMRSNRPKALHTLAGLPLLEHVLRAVFPLSPSRTIVVVGYGGEKIRAAFSNRDVIFVDQGEPLGTGHAVLAAKSAAWAPRLLVLPGDVPLVPPEALRELVLHHEQTGATLSFLTMELSDPGRYGRVVREGGRVKKIVEANAASAAEREIREVNSGIYCLENTPEFWQSLANLKANDISGEFYLTDLVEIFARSGKVVALRWPTPDDLLGINDRAELARAEAILRGRILARLMEAGVTILDPTTTYVSPDIEVGLDTTVHPNTHLLGRTKVGEGCELGPGAYLVDAVVEEGARVWYSVLEGAYVGPMARIGPYAHLRPGARIGPRARIGNFVEVKASVIGEEVRAAHLAYIGDAEIGACANIGAGTITCNYDGIRKNRTEIGPGAFIGSNTALVAPVRIGEGAVVGAGSVITEDVPPYALAIGRAPQVIKPDWTKRREIAET